MHGNHLISSTLSCFCIFLLFKGKYSISWIWNGIGKNCLLGHKKKIAEFLMRTCTCRSTFLFGFCPSERGPRMSERFCLSGTTVTKYVTSILILINTQKYVLIYEKRKELNIYFDTFIGTSKQSEKTKTFFFVLIQSQKLLSAYPIRIV